MERTSFEGGGDVESSAVEGYGGGVEAPSFVIFGEVLGGFEDVV